MEEQAVDAVIARYLLLAESPDESDIDRWVERVDEDDADLEVVERGEEDDRIARRFPVADVQILVAFNVED